MNYVYNYFTSSFKSAKNSGSMNINGIWLFYHTHTHTHKQIYILYIFLYKLQDINT